MNNNDTSDISSISLHKGALDAASKAVGEFLRKSEVEQISDFDFDHSLFIRAGDVLKNAGPKEVVISGFSLMSECLNAALRYHLSQSTKRDQIDLLNGLGPLSSDSARLRLVRLMGWLPAIISDGIEAFRRTRNTVAHEIMFDDDVDVISKIPDPTKEYLNSIIIPITTAYIEALKDNYSNPIEDFFNTEEPDPRIYAIMLAMKLLESVVCGPGKLRLGMGATPGVFFGRDDEPEWANTTSRSSIRAILELMNIHDKLTPC